MPVHLGAPVLRSRPSSTPSVDDFCHAVPMSSRLTKKSFVSTPGRLVNTPCALPPALAPSTRIPPTSTVISGAVSVSSCALSTSSSAARPSRPWRAKLRKPSASGSRTAKDSTSVCACDASVRPGTKGTVTSCPACFAAASMAAPPASTIRSASEILLPPAAPASKSLRTRSSTSITRASSAGSLTAQSFCGARRMRAPLAPPRLSLPRKVAADAQAVRTSCAVDRPEASTAAFSAAMSSSPTSGWSTAGTGSCQIIGSAGTSLPR